MIEQALKNLISKMQSRLDKDEDWADIGMQVPGYLGMLEMVLVMVQNQPQVAHPVGKVRMDDLPRHTKGVVGRRTKAQVMEERSHAVMGGCCERFANHQACNCLEEGL
jgi:hypothetical protein